MLKDCILKLSQIDIFMLRVLSIYLFVVLVGVFWIYDGRVAVFLVGSFTCVGCAL